METQEKMRMRAHKRRMIANQRQKKQEGLSNILRRIKEEITESTTTGNTTEKTFSSLYSSIPSLKGLLLEGNASDISCSSFWSSIPSSCTPDQAVLDSSIVSDKRLREEAGRQKKYLKKLGRQLKCGVITQKEMEEMLDTFGRKNLKEENEEHGSFSLLSSSRGLRKRQQVENIASLFQIFGERKVVVDFGSGSGNLCLALASIHKNTTFVFADQNRESLEILANRAREGGLSNVRVKVFSFNIDNLGEFIKEMEKEIGPSFDFGIGLHCCGRFTDLVMEVCRLAMADCVVVPCCNGKMDKECRTLANKDDKGEDIVKTTLSTYPRSAFISNLITRDEYFQVSRAADDENNYEAKCLIEYDRAGWARENGFEVSLLRMEPVSCTPKHHVLYCSFKVQ